MFGGLKRIEYLHQQTRRIYHFGLESYALSLWYVDARLLKPRILFW